MRELSVKFYVKMLGLKDSIFQDERGQDLIEYALVVALIALAATAGMKTVATAIGSAFTNVGTKLNTYTS